MNGPTWAAIAAGALLGIVLLLAGLGWRRGRRRTRIDAPDQAMDAAANALAGFHPLAAAVGVDGAAALVSGVGDRLVILRSVGRRVRAREIGWQAVRATAEGIVVEAEGRRFACVPLAGVDALDVRRLAPARERADVVITGAGAVIA